MGSYNTSDMTTPVFVASIVASISEFYTKNARPYFIPKSPGSRKREYFAAIEEDKKIVMV